MFRNYLKIALRNLVRYKGYTAINVLGLTAGIASCVLICLYIQDELSYDRFHAQADRIYRIDNELHIQSDVYKYPTCTSAIPVAMDRDIAGVNGYTRFSRFGNGANNEVIVRINPAAGSPRFFKERGTYAADPSVFSLFSFDLLKGEKETALDAPYSVVITEEIARKYFGETDPLGKVITFTGVLPAPVTDQDFKVTGVLAPVPSNSHIHFDMLVSMETLGALIRANNANNPNPNNQDPLNSWQNDGFYSYVLLDAYKNPKDIEKQLPALVDKHVEDRAQRAFVNPSLVPLTDIHLHSNLRNELEPNGSLTSIYIFSTVALLILIIAAVNYTNLAIARSVRRSREVGMRKVLGASKRQLMNQFLSESVLLTTLATVLGLLVARFLLLGAFNQLAGKQLSIQWLDNGFVWLLLGFIILFVGLVSGSYPALFLSSMPTLDVLKSGGSGKSGGGTGSTSLLRKGLVVFQFVISVILIIGTWTVYNQLNYIKTKDLGYDKDQILVLPDANAILTPRFNTFKAELTRNPAIRSITGSLSAPGGLRLITIVKTETLPDVQNLNLAAINCDFDYLKTMGIQLVQGRDFDPAQGLDSTEAIIVNEAAVGILNLGDQPVGKIIEVTEANGFVRKRIIGVAKNTNFEPLYRKTEGAFYTPFPAFYTNIFVKIDPARLAQAIEAVRQVWDKFVANQPLEYAFLSENLNRLYVAEEKLGKIITYFSLLAVLIACLGLFGLASFSIEQRVKEIGIRKVMGATVLDVLVLLSKEYIWLIGIATLIAWPLAYYLIHQWMGNFVFHADIPWYAFVAAGFIVCVLALLTVNFKAIRAAQSNPVKSLRSE
jgi:putative ABC transport system permease protein